SSVPVARPSTVETERPLAWTASTRQDLTAAPSRTTVHAPQTPCSQPIFVPVSSSSSLRKSASVSLGGTVRSYRSPLTVRLTERLSSAGAFMRSPLPREPRGARERRRAAAEIGRAHV